MNDLDKKVLESIAQRGLKPRPVAFFLAKRWVFWTLAAVSLVLGAISVAALIFAVTDFRATGGRGFDEMPLDDVFEVLPYVWLACLGLFAASTYYGVRQTRRGYRFSGSHIIGATLLANVALGYGLHLAGAGQAAHEFLKSHLPAYAALTTPGEQGWGTPDQGYLAGRVVHFDGRHTLTIQAFDGHEWTVETDGAKVTLDEPFGSREDVAIRGEKTGLAAFRARSIRDWD